MGNGVALPRVLGFRLKGFAPIFSSDVAVDLRDSPFVFLGGNGLGKTTLIQAVIYGLAGGLDEQIEESKQLRWGQSYFRQRLARSAAQHAEVEVDFALPGITLSVRRRFRGSQVVGLRVGNDEWIEQPSLASEEFRRQLECFGGYRSESDFAYLVHRLLYLPESRRLLMWDTDAQLRVLMLLNQDVIDEEAFRTGRARLKRLDSKKRHTRVVLNKVDQSLGSLFDPIDGDEPQEQDSDSDDDEGESLSEPGSHTDESGEDDLGNLIDRLSQAGRARTVKLRDVEEVSSDLSEVSLCIEQLRAQIDDAEATIISGLLSASERELELALHKLLHNDQCPACGTPQPGLAEGARDHVRHHRCALCGSEEPTPPEPALATLRSQLAERLRAQRVLEDQLRRKQHELELARKLEMTLQSQVNEQRFSQPVAYPKEEEIPPKLRSEAEGRRAELLQREFDYGAQIQDTKRNLEGQYDAFRDAVADRMALFSSLFVDYATQFLGLDCEVVETTKDGLMSISSFVPSFLGIKRNTPDSCSEAQRFFLDIAFRMAIMNMASSISGFRSSFFCETPETALDMSYVDNVVRMFWQFIQRGHAVALTANIQPDGFAEQLLQQVQSPERSSHVLDMLSVGVLSHVQEAALPELKAAVAKIVGSRRPTL